MNYIVNETCSLLLFTFFVRNKKHSHLVSLFKIYFVHNLLNQIPLVEKLNKTELSIVDGEILIILINCFTYAALRHFPAVTVHQTLAKALSI